MTKEEICVLRRDMHRCVKAFMEQLAEYTHSKKDYSPSVAMDIADMIKDMSEAEKNLAKADYYDRKIN